MSILSAILIFLGLGIAGMDHPSIWGVLFTGTLGLGMFGLGLHLLPEVDRG